MNTPSFQHKIDHLNEVVELLGQLHSVIGQGCYNDKIRDLEDTSKDLQALFDRFCPFKLKDRVQLTKTPVINDEEAWGWAYAKHFLVVGAKATVESIDFINVKFVFYCVFDDDSHIHYQTKEKIKNTNPGLFRFSEDYLEKAVEKTDSDGKVAVNTIVTIPGF